MLALTLDYVETARKARAEGRPEPPMPAGLEEHFPSLTLRPMSPVTQAMANILHADFSGQQGQAPLSIPTKRNSRRERPTVSQLFHRSNEVEKEKGESIYVKKQTHSQTRSRFFAVWPRAFLLASRSRNCGRLSSPPGPRRTPTK